MAIYELVFLKECGRSLPDSLIQGLCEKESFDESVVPDELVPIKVIV